MTGSTVPTTVMLCPMSARVTVAVRYPELPPLVAAQAAAPPPSTTISTMAPMTTARRWPERPQPERVELGTATAGGAPTEATAATEEAATAAEATGARCATGRGDADGGRRHRAVVAAGPNALTQSPTARSVDAADWVGGHRRGSRSS